MQIQFPATLTLSIEEARIVLAGLRLVNAETFTKNEPPVRHERRNKAADLFCQLADHIEHYEHLEATCYGEVLAVEYVDTAKGNP